ncbi:FAD-dependent monooxygenase [Lysobacter sp. N42]|uniref:FAD-dependent monooxygenase n=1 Tax=Lysobacter sp. N42 TaxID=2545719 RepID=UPI000DD0624D|nr:FAD-dependent monooxygenase [Lysobacter sp. N42]TCZ92772.1 hypothetical protein EYQ95_01900 [Lysobacter sp. N42]
MLVVGAGMVGGALAIGLAKKGYDVTVLDPNFTRAWSAASDYDLRISAVTADNIELLQSLGVWPEIAKCRANPFFQLAVTDSSENWLEFGDSEEGNHPLGYMIENSVLQYAVFQQLQQYPNIQLLEAGLQSIDFNNRVVKAETKASPEGGDESHYEVEFEHLLGCDGANSKVREQSGIGVSGKQYKDACLLVNVKTEKPVAKRTWEKFSADEIHALLPLDPNHACLIVYANKETISNWSSSKDQLAEHLNSRFESIGPFSVESYGHFPLQRQSANRYGIAPVTQNSELKTPFIALFGDAAHTIHPLAGQGVNLGFRDVECFLQQVDKFGFSQQAQARYEKQRRLDNEFMAHSLEWVGWGMRSENKALKRVRAFGLNILGRLPGMQYALSAYASRAWKVSTKG